MDRKGSVLVVHAPPGQSPDALGLTPSGRTLIFHRFRHASGSRRAVERRPLPDGDERCDGDTRVAHERPFGQRAPGPHRRGADQPPGLARPQRGRKPPRRLRHRHRLRRRNRAARTATTGRDHTAGQRQYHDRPLFPRRHAPAVLVGQRDRRVAPHAGGSAGAAQLDRDRERMQRMWQHAPDSLTSRRPCPCSRRQRRRSGRPATRQQ